MDHGLNGSLLKRRVDANEKKLFVNVAVWDGSLSPPKPGEVLVVGNLIQEVAAPGQIDKSDNSSQRLIIIDGAGSTLMPGLIDGHAHISFNDSFDFNIHPEEHTLITMHGARKLLDAGFTSAFSAASAKVRLDLVIRNEINAGRIPGPRLRAAGPELTCPGGLGDGEMSGLHQSNTFGYRVDGPAQMTETCEMLVAQGVDTIKLNISGEDYTYKDGKEDIPTTFTEEEVAAAVRVCKKAGIKTAAHCRGSDSVRIAIDHDIDAIYHCEYADDASLELLAKKRDKVFLGPAIGFLIRGGLGYKEGKPDKKAHLAAATYQKLMKLEPNMRVIIGGDYGFPPTPQGDNAFDLQALVEWCKFTPIRALVAGTAHGGELMGMPVGQIKKDYFADLLLVKGDPTTDVTLLQNKDNITLIMQDGYIYKNILQAL